MTSGGTTKSGSAFGAAPYAWLALSFLNLFVQRRWPDSLASTLSSRAFIAVVTIWFVMRIRTGYLLRRPHWTRDSWLRYLRLAAMPVVAVVVVLYMSSFDNRSNALGAPHTPTRFIAAIGFMILLVSGAIGLGTAADWLVRGEPSQQFTRTRWFQRRPPKATAQ